MGGDILVSEQKLIGETEENNVNLHSGWSVNASIKIPRTNISWEQSLSGEFFDSASWEYANTIKMSIDQPDIYAEGGFSLDKNGLNIRTEVGGAGDISGSLPESIKGDSSELSWSLTGDIHLLNWDQLVELALSAVAIVALSTVCAVLILDDGTIVGLANDGLLVPIGTYITERINAIEQIISDIAANISKCL